MSKQILNGKELREKLLIGIEKIADTVSITLGPKGRNVGLNKKFVDPLVIHDGVSVAREIELEDPYENFGAQLVRQASAKTADNAGDGTTTSTLLAWKLVEKGFKRIEEEKVNPMIYRAGLEKASQDIIKLIKEMSTEVKTKEDLINVATVSCADEKLGKIIAEAIYKVGKDGVVTVEESEVADTSIEYKEGMEFDKGMVSPFFATDQAKNEAELPAPHIFITDFPLLNAVEIAEPLEKIIKQTNKAEILFIAPAIEGTALSTLVLNRVRGNIRPLAVMAPSFAERRKDILEDIAVLTGATVISKDKGMKLDEIDLSWLGSADKVVSDMSKTKIIGGRGDAKKIQERVDSIKDQISKTKSDFEKTKLKERLSKLTSGAAVINVGGMTEVEMKERKERVIDAVEASKSAMEEGIVAGGGVCLYNIFSKLNSNALTDDDSIKGYQDVIKTLIAPITKILDNAGEDTPMIISKTGLCWGYNVMKREFGDMIQMGIIDPTKVVRNAVENAISVASLLITTEAVVTDVPEKHAGKETQ